jgi:hypothetical protein
MASIPESTIETIKEWMLCDNEIRILQSELKIRRNEKKQKTLQIIEAMKRNEIDCFAVKDGQLQYKKRCVKKPLSQSMLLKLLMDYHDGNAERAIELQQYLKANREEVIQENIVFK